MTDSRIPEFWQLVIHAERRGKAVDDFDLHSDDSQSRAEFQRLMGEQHTAVLELIEYIAAHAEELRHNFSDKHIISGASL